MQTFDEVKKNGFTYVVEPAVLNKLTEIAGRLGHTKPIEYPIFYVEPVAKRPIKELSLKDNIKANLNKVSDKNFTTILQTVSTLLTNATDEKEFEVVYTTLSSNIQYSQMFADMYWALALVRKELNDTFNIKLDAYLLALTNLTVDPDMYEHNKKCDKLKSQTAFIKASTHHIPKSIIYKVVDTLIQLPLIDECIQHIALLFSIDLYFYEPLLEYLNIHSSNKNTKIAFTCQQLLEKIDN